MILALKTNSTEANVQLLAKNGDVIDTYTWRAHRTLAKDLLKTIHDRLQANKLDWEDIEEIIVFKGPGSFTGLRIGAAVANTLAHTQKVPIVGEQGDSWVQNGITRLQSSANDTLVIPEYGGEANITKPRK